MTQQENLNKLLDIIEKDNSNAMVMLVALVGNIAGSMAVISDKINEVEQ